MDISLRDLEAAFAKLPVEVRTTLDVFTRSGTPVHSFRYPVTNAEATARRFFDHLRVYRERDHEDSPFGRVDADLCARCGSQFKPGQVCDACRESHSYQLSEALKQPDVVDADIPDPEVAAIAAIVAAMDALDEATILLGTDVHERVIRWAMARYLGPVSG